MILTVYFNFKKITQLLPPAINFLLRSSIYSLLIFFFACEAKSPDTKPNVILILTDDQGYGDLGIHGNADINTGLGVY
ncbi:MAG: hypothetical protein P8O16_11710 [Algoriphagus sp.]|uniref:hypothetical protein n=1 Tax=Algoriphagus sp. TaxID=1872435 RepID=UPI00260F1084|nr:hypothetical protein [Algoriphagus sp.]MDG1277938.1 hypothetical protein [Algoriphagus sp.]